MDMDNSNLRAFIYYTGLNDGKSVLCICTKWQHDVATEKAIIVI